MSNGRYKMKSNEEIEARKKEVRESWIVARENAIYDESSFIEKLKINISRTKRKYIYNGGDTNG